MISTVIAKPTKKCNADCSYCSTPPDGNGPWSVSDFIRYFDNIKDQLSAQAVWLWHGGEPMLMGPDFYEKCYEHAIKTHPQIRFSMQSNILLYNTLRWKKTLNEVFKGSLSTSYDPDEENRTIQGSPQKFHKVFFKKLDLMIEDGFKPSVIGTYTKESMDLALPLYEKSLNLKEKSFSLRFNYRYPVGRAYNQGESISPEDYGLMLLNLYNKWIKDNPNFMITPLDEMLGKVIGVEGSRCPWTNSCGGRFLSIDPDGSVYNCAEFGSLGQSLEDEGLLNEYKFGNLNEHSIKELMSSKACLNISRRRIQTPKDCQSCDHYAECEGGCARDAALYGRGLIGKFYYCKSWMMIFERIKESVISGEADQLIKSKYGLNPENVRQWIGSKGKIIRISNV